MINIAPASALAFILLALAFILVLGFEAANGFHDSANAVATVIYTNSLKPRIAVVLSGVMNFIGVVVGGIAVAYALVGLLPADVLSPPDGSPAIPMLLTLFATALGWNLLTWWFGIPNSSSHCVIGALVGVALGDTMINHLPLAQGVDWSQIWNVLRALAISPLLGLVGAGLLYFAIRHLLPPNKDPHLYEPPRGKAPPTWGVRSLLILTCTGVSFSHGTNDGQKSIGLIMLTIIGLLPATYALNPAAQLTDLPQLAGQALPLVQQYGGARREFAVRAAQHLDDGGSTVRLASLNDAQAGSPPPAQTRSAVRADVYRIVSELKQVEKNPQAPADAKSQAKTISAKLRPSVEYAPWWVRVLSALCLGIGTMIGYQRIVRTLGERVGNTHLTPAQGASAELVGAGLIATAGFTGLPVSTTHIITSGIAGTMIGSGSGLNRGTIMRIVAAWVFTLPITIAIAATLFYLLGSPVQY